MCLPYSETHKTIKQLLLATMLQIQTLWPSHILPPPCACRPITRPHRPCTELTLDSFWLMIPMTHPNTCHAWHWSMTWDHKLEGNWHMPKSPTYVFSNMLCDLRAMCPTMHSIQFFAPCMYTPIACTHPNGSISHSTLFLQISTRFSTGHFFTAILQLDCHKRQQQQQQPSQTSAV